MAKTEVRKDGRGLRTVKARCRRCKKRVSIAREISTHVGGWDGCVHGIIEFCPKCGTVFISLFGLTGELS